MRVMSDERAANRADPDTGEVTINNVTFFVSGSGGVRVVKDASGAIVGDFNLFREGDRWVAYGNGIALQVGHDWIGVCKLVGRDP